ncbi:FAD dependent oxidoreductase [Hesseltinella vesiculosa]|uniref:FAD dependent oxidoreductase n=1 Tax=Hesseltinella vesiculosa TaxID=101127 RepID=A0A1X2GWR9_9FUNG|nr:FAD dependent oxidoreductase [Hesseltinella vesiculosa]
MSTTIPKQKIIIVGGGCFGLSSAYALSLKPEYEVWVYDRLPIPVPDAASTDVNKIVRADYGDDTLYMHLMFEAFPLWHQFNKEREALGQSPVFHQSGVLLLSSNGSYSPFEQASLKSIREAGHGYAIEEFLTPESIVSRFPQFKGAVDRGYDIGYLNKEGGWCNSREAVVHMYNKCISQGVRFVTGSGQGEFGSLFCPESSRIVRGIVTKDGQVHLADRVLLATGAWSAGVVDMKKLVTATGQAVVHFEPKGTMLNQFQSADCPVWCGDLSRTGFYGFPANAEGKMKVGIHNAGYLWPRESDQVSVPRTQVTHTDDTIPLNGLRQFRQFLGGFLPETSALDITYSRLCWYSDAIDGQFVIDYHPDYENLIVATGDSGHGMKFIPNIGMHIRDVIEGRATDYTRRWAWRQLETSETKLDGLRSGNEVKRGIIASEQEGMRLVELDELKASRPQL